MSPKDRWFRRPWIAAIIFVVVAGFTVLISGQQGGQVANPTNSLQVPILSHGPQEGPEGIQGLPDDWTHHHLVFSNPGTEEEAIQNGTHERWLKVVNDPRYIMQQLRRRAPAQGPYAGYVDRMNEAARDTADSASLDLPTDQLEDDFRLVKGHRPGEPGRPSGPAIDRDWAESLGVAATGTGTVSSNNASSSSSFSVGGSGTISASAPTAATQTGSFSSPPTSLTGGNPTIGITVGSNTLNLSTNASAQTAMGTFSGPPLTSTTISITSGTNILGLTTNGTAANVKGTFASTPPSSNPAITVTSGTTTTNFTTNATTASAIGTVSGLPTSATAPTITIANSAGATSSTLSLTTNATAQQAIGTFSAGATSGTVTIKSGSNTLTLTAAASTSTGTVNNTASNGATGNDTVTIGGVVYEFEQTYNGCSGANVCVWYGDTASGENEGENDQVAQSLEAAINNNSSQCPANFNTYFGSEWGSSVCYYVITSADAPNPYASGSGASTTNHTVTVTNLTNSTLTESTNKSSEFTVTSSISAAASGCSGSSSTTGSFIIDGNSTTQQASNLNGVINSCNTGNSAVGVTATTSGATVTITDTTLGPSPGLTLGGTATDFGWGTVTGGSAGTNGCSSSTTGTFATASTATNPNNQVASNLATAITNCNSSYPAVGLSATSSTNTFTVTNPTPGPFLAVGGTSLGSLFSWGSVTGGLAGSPACSGTAGTFATAPSGTAGSSTAGLTDLASSLQQAIADCTSNGISATTSTNTVTVSDTTPGNFTTFSAAGGAAGYFTWGGVTAGTNGSAGCAGTTGTFVTSNNTTTLAGDVSAAIALCPASAGISATSSTNTVTLTDTTLGASDTSAFSVTATNNTGLFSWGTPSAGSDGSYTCSGSSSPYTATYATSSSTTTLAAHLSSAITNCNGSAVGVSSTSSTNTVKLTAATAGTGGNSGTLAPTAGSPFAWSAGSLSGGTDGTTSGTSFAYWSVNAPVSTTQLATNIATAINDNTNLEASTGASATSSNNVVTVSARTAGTPGNSIATPTPTSFSGFNWGAADLSDGASGTVQPNASPAKFSFSTSSASCSDYVVYPTGLAGSATAATVVAYNNLYSGCTTGSVPSVNWAYNTGGTVTTSPILSYSDNGAQVAFIQVSGTTASLVLLKWAAAGGSVTSPTTLTSQSSGSSYRSCAAPCMYSVALSGSPNDTLSAPFYDYYDDVLYVGDDSGNLHQFSGVFNGSPGENTTSPWPVHLGSNKLSSPVYDSATAGSFQGGYVFVGDMGGVFYSVGTGAGGTTNGQVHSTGSLGDAIADGPLVDSSEGTEFVFVTTDGSSKPYSGGNGVFEFVSSFTAYGTPGVVSVGTGGTGYYLYAGDFDNVYYQSGNPAYGHLYVVGNTGTAGGATLYQVDIAYSSMTGTVNAVATGLNTTAHPWPSSLTEFCNNGASACAITSQRSVTGKVSTTGPEITLSSGTFSSTDVGAVVVGSDTSCSGASCIPFGDTISSVLNSTTANLTTAPGGAVTSETLYIRGGETTSGTDYVFFSVNSPASGLCKNSSGTAESGAGWGCILSYNVTNPTAVAQSGGAGAGLAVTVPGTNGCWATGGLVIDNSVPSGTMSGASQIYFVNLNGAAAGGPAGQTSSNCTAGAAAGNATQASQASP